MVSRLMRHVIAVSSLLVMMIASRAGALDTITRKSTDRRAAGEITSVSKSEVTVKPKVGSPTTVPANDIAGIEWDAEPAALGLARAKEASGQYTLAIADYEKALQESSAGKPQLKADIAFGIASATGKLALVEPEQREAAIARLNGFIDSHPDHYRHYDALLLLGQTYLNQENFAGAEGAFQRVMDSPWTDYRMAASVALGRTSLARGDAAGARAAFDRVATASPSGAAEVSRRFEAMLGQAACLQSEQKFSEAADILGHVIRESAADDTRLQAEAFVRQGDCFAALEGRTKEAVMAYLHVEVVPSLAAHKDLHAEALYQLTQLSPQMGHPERGDQAAAKLQTLYPNSPWTKKLTGG